MKPSIYPIDADYPGQMYIMPKPSSEWLQEDIEHYRSIGIDTIISMLETSEAIELSLQDEEKICTAHKMDFLNFPIPDRGLPETAPFMELVGTAQSQLKNEKKIAVHCRAGIGRSGMLVCCVLAGFIGSTTAVLKLVSQARGAEVPDTHDQRQFIEEVVNNLPS